MHNWGHSGFSKIYKHIEVPSFIFFLLFLKIFVRIMEKQKSCLKRFDIGRVCIGTRALFVGKRASGKTFLVKNILQQNENQTAPTKIVIHETKHINEYKKHDTIAHEGYDPAIINSFMKRQKTACALSQKDDLLHFDTRSILVLEDCFYEKSVFKDEQMHQLIMNSKDIDCMVLMIMQYPLDIPPILRSGIDFIFIYRDYIIHSRKRLYENFASFIPTFEIFCVIMDQYTQNHDCLVIDNTTNSTKIKDRLFLFNAKE